jgi:hypothetical protein
MRPAPLAEERRSFIARLSRKRGHLLQKCFVTSVNRDARILKASGRIAGSLSPDRAILDVG